MELNKKLLGKRIKEARNKKGLTQENLAELINVSSFYISRLESGGKSPSVETLIKLSNTLDVSADYLLSNNVYTSIVYLKGDLATLLNDCSTNDMNLILTVVEAILEHNKNSKL